MTFIKHYIIMHWKFLILPIFSMIVCLGIDLYMPLIQKDFVDNQIIKGELFNIPLFILFFFSLVATRAILSYVKEYLFDVFSIKVIKHLRHDLFSKIQTLPFSFFDQTNTGELMSRIGEDADLVWETLGFGLRLLIEMIFIVLFSAYIMFSMNPTLATICLLILVPVTVMGWFFEKKFWDVYTKISDQLAQVNSTTQQNISGIRLVKAFAREKHEIIKFLKSNEALYDLTLSQTKLVSQFVPLVEALSQLSHIALIIIGGIFCIRGDISIGVLLAFSSYIMGLSWCVRNMSAFINMISQNKASLDRIYKLFNLESDLQSPPNGYAPSSVKGDICFKDVCFSYDETTVLKNINLFIPAGSSVAIMGPTGCGKSTLISLIGRYYDVTSGEVLVDGVNVKDWDLSVLRKHIAIVFQDTFLFSDTISNNVNFGEEYKGKDLAKALELSAAQSFIEELEGGIETEIGERGVGLSGGQKQRLTIARALVPEAPILILDDATSALDTETEYDVLQNLAARSHSCTSFIIAHRISGVKDAHLILYMEKGEILERGTHTDLLERKGYYYSIYKDQFETLDFDQEVIV